MSQKEQIVAIDRFGRMVLPKKIRAMLIGNAETGKIEIMPSGSEFIIRTHVDKRCKLRRKNGMLVWDPGIAPLTEAEVLEAEVAGREERLRRTMGWDNDEDIT